MKYSIIDGCILNEDPAYGFTEVFEVFGDYLYYVIAGYKSEDVLHGIELVDF